MSIPKNLKEAREQGYREGRRAFERGYITRKPRDEAKVEVYQSRSGELYYLAPSWSSTRYCWRQYLTK